MQSGHPGGGPAFQNPTKPIGPFYTEEEAKKLAAERGWAVRDDAGCGWRRVVPSPIPQEIVEQEAIKALIEQGFVVIGVGGGGIPSRSRWTRIHSRA